MTFEDFREYVPGDDIRNISWQLTAKTGKTFIKKFQEERERAILIAIDVSGSQFFGTGKTSKMELSIFVAATLCFSCLRKKDSVGLLLFSNEVEKFIPPKKGRSQVYHILSELFSFKPKKEKTDFSAPFSFLQNVLKKKMSIFILSDFLAEDFKKPLTLLGKKHEVSCFILEDSFEKEIASLGLIEFLDLETGKTQLVDTSLSATKNMYKKQVKELIKKRDQQIHTSGSDSVCLSDREDVIKQLTSFFGRKKR